MKTFFEQLRLASDRHQSMLCVGLDPDPARFPQAIVPTAEGLFEFCARIVDSTCDQVCAFKPQFAYFAAHRAEAQLENLIEYIHKVAPMVPVILDAKRGDIGSTAQQYAREAFERYNADAVTLSPFMGFDSIEPYLTYKNKAVFLLCRTSNPGGVDLQSQKLHEIAGQPRVFEHIAQLAAHEWNREGIAGQIGLVVGATYPQEIATVRAIAPNLPLLLPGIGAQGGDAIAAVRAGFGTIGSIVVNSSRAILYAGSGVDFDLMARNEAIRTRLELENARLLAQKEI